MAVVYILFSPEINKYYVGSCFDLDKRLSDHKNKIHPNAYTKITDDWELYHFIDDLDRATARGIEMHIKSMKSRKYIQDLKKYPEMTIKLIDKYSSR